MKDPFHPYFSNLERYDRFEEISSHDKFIVSIEMYARPTSRENLGIRCEKVGSTWLVSFERERRLEEKSGILVSTCCLSDPCEREIYLYTTRCPAREKENGGGGCDETSLRFVRERVACRACRLRLYFIASRVACKFNLVEVTQMQ